MLGSLLDTLLVVGMYAGMVVICIVVIALSGVTREKK